MQRSGYEISSSCRMKLCLLCTRWNKLTVVLFCLVTTSISTGTAAHSVEWSDKRIQGATLFQDQGLTQFKTSVPYHASPLFHAGTDISHRMVIGRPWQKLTRFTCIALTAGPSPQHSRFCCDASPGLLSYLPCSAARSPLSNIATVRCPAGRRVRTSVPNPAAHLCSLLGFQRLAVRAQCYC